MTPDANATPDSNDSIDAIPPRIRRPLLGMMIAPRRTIRAIVDGEPTRGVLLLGIACGIAIVLAVMAALGADWILAGERSARLVTLFVDGPILGLVMLFFLGRMLAWSGQAFFGGKATDREVRSAVAWACSGSLWIGALAILHVVCTRLAPGVSGANWIRGIEITAAVIACWTFFVFLRAVGEVHRFSALKALLASVVAIIALAVVLAIPVGSLAFVLEFV